MTERDPVVAVLKELDRPAAPRPEFADALRDRLLAEVAETEASNAARHAPRHRWALPRLQSRRLVVGAIALGLGAAAIATVVLSRPSEASALDVVRQARRAFAEAPPFEATLTVDLNPDGSSPGVPKGATATVRISYGGANRFRTQIDAVAPRFPSATSPGSYEVFDGHTVARFDSERNRFDSSPAPSGFRPLDYFSWRGAYPNWERICSAPGSEVLADGEVAGRGTRHIRCGDFRGDTWELWIDDETGLLLKIVGPVAGDDLFLDLGSGASSKGGFEVERLRLDPSFRARTFSTSAPVGATDFQARLRAAAARVPPFHATLEGRSQGKTYVDEVWWLSHERWRHEVLVGQDPAWPGGAGSFVVSSGGAPESYNARENSYSRSTFSATADPIVPLLPLWPDYSSAVCPIVRGGRVAGREAVHRRCNGYEVWLDGSTGLVLRYESPAYELLVRSVEYQPAIPPGTFAFEPPPGARSADQPQRDPYYKTALAPGKHAPTWAANALGGRTFDVADLRGKPALLLLLPDWCPAGDRACEVFAPLQQLNEMVEGRIAVVWVDLQGSAERARKIRRHNRLSFPVVVDAAGASIRSWKFRAYPYWVLLDSQGGVVEARLGPQSITELRQLAAKATR